MRKECRQRHRSYKLFYKKPRDLFGPLSFLENTPIEPSNFLLYCLIFLIVRISLWISKVKTFLWSKIFYIQKFLRSHLTQPSSFLKFFGHLTASFLAGFSLIKKEWMEKSSAVKTKRFLIKKVSCDPSACFIYESQLSF